MIDCRALCTATHPGPRDDAIEDGWLIVSPDRAAPVLCPDHANLHIAPHAHVFGPEYEMLASRVPVDGDYLITSVGIHCRVGDGWVLVQEWPVKVAAA